MNNQSEPNNLLLRDFIRMQADKWNDKPFILYQNESLSYRDSDLRSNRIANGLLNVGVEKGDKVGLLLANHPDYVLIRFALAKTGGVLVPINTALKGEGLKYIIDHADISTLIVDEQLWPNVKNILEGLKKVKNLILAAEELPADYDRGPKLDKFSEIVSESTDLPEAALKPDDMAVILYTSGTTGPPKGVVFPHISPMFAKRPSRYKAEDVVYTCLPLFHANALALTVQMAFDVGATVALGKSFSAANFWDDTRRYNATWTSLLGAMIPILYKQPEKEDDPNNPVKYIASAAAPREVWRAFEQRFDVRLIEGYGAVDGAGALINSEGRVGSIGKPADWCEAKVVDDEGYEVEPGTTGQLMTRIKGENYRVTYYKDEEASANKNKDGWVLSGDYVYYDQDCFYYFVDRQSEAIRRRGENISSWEVEKVINQHPAVLEAAVFGVASELGEEEVMAMIVLQPGKAIDPLDIIKWCENKLAYFMVPRFIEFADKIEKTGTQRAQKNKLKQRGVTDNTWDLTTTGYELKR